MVLGLPQRALIVPLVDLFLRRQIERDARRVDLEVIAPDVDLALFADEARAAHQIVVLRLRQIQMHLDAAGVAEGDGAGRFCERPEFHRARAVHPQRHLDLIDPVGAPIRHFSAGIFVETHPAELDLLAIRTQLCLSGPDLPIELVGLRLLRKSGDRRRGSIIHAVNQLERAQAARANQLAGHLVHLHRALLAADLEDGLILSRGLHQHRALAGI